MMAWALSAQPAPPTNSPGRSSKRCKSSTTSPFDLRFAALRIGRRDSVRPGRDRLRDRVFARARNPSHARKFDL